MVLALGGMAASWAWSASTDGDWSSQSTLFIDANLALLAAVFVVALAAVAVAIRNGSTALTICAIGVATLTALYVFGSFIAIGLSTSGRT
jgi:hypothetical protein